ncbi:MAG: hypothetical protein NC299_06085 [Lachnospiraceae bacterium]|nr:hypothetical protein [Ruminococcus sp.]MCM1274922.1 hypothetical protein [Lachnospiraceae bacterium]
MVLTPEIKAKMLEDIQTLSLHNTDREVMLTLSNYGIKSTRDARDEIIEWLKEELEISKIYPNNDMIDIFLKKK